MLRNPASAQIVLDTWTFFDGECYDLISYVVIPNHVHVLIKTYEGHSLSDLIHSWKSFTSNEIKKFLRNNAGEEKRREGI
ncbi:transposase [Lentisphaera profundi]|uniref:transposase n=1 Tax=Lentisphaera profundi TaxID=1658616 RepID=UPI003B67151E